MIIEALVQDPFARKQSHLRYKADPSLEIQVGDMILVPLRGTEKLAFVLNIIDENPDLFKLKEVILKIPAMQLEAWQIHIAEWLAEQNFCPLFDVIKHMVPKHIWRLPTKRSVKNLATEPMESSFTTKAEAPQTPDSPRLLWSHPNKNHRFERYAAWAQQSLEQGKSVILLVPDRYLEEERLDIFREHGLAFETWTSFTSEGEKARIWQGAKHGKIRFVIGTRSSLFIPMKNLDWIILDEENELAYKQDSLPRYQTRSLAMQIQFQRGARLLLGGECASIEAQFWAEEGRIEWLQEAPTTEPQLSIKIIDMREELRAKNYSILSEAVQQNLQKNILENKQSLLILNKAGYSRSTLCRDCGYSPTCPHCECALTYHKWMEGRNEELYFCHTCNYSSKVSLECPSCHGSRFKLMGAGTEKVEEVCREKYPDTPVFRIDKESFKNRKDYKKLCADIEANPNAIIISTSNLQRAIPMKALASITLLLADQGLSFPDFRAEERWLQRAMQIRSKLAEQGEAKAFFIQSYHIEHLVFEHFFNSSYLEFSKQEIQRRKEFLFPPILSVAKLTLKNMNKKLAHEKAHKFKSLLEEVSSKLAGTTRLTLSPAMQYKKRGFYYWNVLLFRDDPHEVLSQIHPEILREWTLDLDPLNML